MSRLVVGPFNRVEGDLEVQLDVQDGRVQSAHVVAPMCRGFEAMLLGRDPKDALTIVPRICGICSVSQSAAASAALAGMRVVVLEQGKYRTAADFKHDELDIIFNDELLNHPGWNDPQTFRRYATETAVQMQGDPPPAFYARGVGGSSVHFTANYWRFHQRSRGKRS